MTGDPAWNNPWLVEVGCRYSSSFACVAFLSGIVSWIAPFSYHIWRETISKKRKVTNFWQGTFFVQQIGGMVNDPQLIWFDDFSRRGHQLLHGGAGWLSERRGCGADCVLPLYFLGQTIFGGKKDSRIPKNHLLNSGISRPKTMGFSEPRPKGKMISDWRDLKILLRQIWNLNF